MSIIYKKTGPQGRQIQLCYFHLPGREESFCIQGSHTTCTSGGHSLPVHLVGRIAGNKNTFYIRSC
jgi:hypothetical protein